MREPTHQPVTVRPYRPSDEGSWVRCRALAFLDTSYFDNVYPSKVPLDANAMELVAVALDAAGAEQVVGILDIELERLIEFGQVIDIEHASEVIQQGIVGRTATIETLAVHPDYRRRGIADALLAHALERLPSGITTLDAWTREDEAACSWYRAQGFAEDSHYLHVHKDWDESSEGFSAPYGLSAPVIAFMHADVEDESVMRGLYRRVYVCRRFAKRLVD
ncbi:GNAT family N-acetyltransferase [Micrococcales bacterium 31B]|nr:GNAT family N-acetyltransferase [Micrococcales bacterium 31B]